MPNTTRPKLSLFGIPFGLAGLAGTWTALHTFAELPSVAATALWVLDAAVLAVLLVRYLILSRGLRGVRDDLNDPIQKPFAALVPVTLMLIGARLYDEAAGAGSVLVIVSVGAATVFAAYFLAGLLRTPTPLTDFHAGYLLPTVAAGLIAAQSLAHIGFTRAALAAFGVGILFWLIIGAIVLARHSTATPLPDQLVPTTAIFAAPPAVAGNAWAAIAPDRSPIADAGHSLLVGLLILLLLSQVILLARYRRLSFSYGFWAFTFTIAASATYATRLIAMTQPPGTAVYVWTLGTVATALIGAVAALSLRLLFREHRESKRLRVHQAAASCELVR